MEPPKQEKSAHVKRYPDAANQQQREREREAPQFDLGALLSVAGERITIEFPDNSSKTFMAEFVWPA